MCVDLDGGVGEGVVPAVGHDDVAAGLEVGKIVRHLAAEEVGGVERGLVHEHGHALGLDALHDALDARGTEVVAVVLHGQSVDAYDGGMNAGVDQLIHLLQDLVGDEVLAGAVRVHDGLDEVLRHVFVVGQELLCVLRQAVAAVAERGVAVEGADAGLEAHAADDVAGGEAPALAIGIELVEVSNPERQVGVREELHGLGGAQDELGDTGGAILVHTLALGRVDAFGQKRGEFLRRAHGLGEARPRGAAASPPTDQVADGTSIPSVNSQLYEGRSVKGHSKATVCPLLLYAIPKRLFA